MLTYLVLPICLVGLIAALGGSGWGATLVLAAAFFGRALDGKGVIPDTMVAETALLLVAFWAITSYVSSLRGRASPSWLPLLGAALGAAVGAVFFRGVDFALVSVVGGVVFAAMEGAQAVVRREARLVLLEPLRVLTVMVAAFWLMFHLT